MSKRVPQLLLEDIVASANKILDYTSELTHEQFLEDEKTMDAVIRNFEIIGEAANSLKTFVRTHAWLLRIGGITAAVIIGFQLIGRLVIYRYLQLDYYVSLVAVAFLATGLLLKRSPRTETAEPPATPDLLTVLTSKEFLVLRLLAEGKTNKEIAVAHFVEVSTVKTHINNIYAKLTVSNRAQARARYAEIAAKLPIS